MKFKAIIFDMDGTIIDTNPVWEQAVRKLVANKGITLTTELEQMIQARIHGLSVHNSCVIIKEVIGLEDPVEQLVHEKKKIAVSMYHQGISFIPGFVEFHRDITKKNMKSGIATNADDATFKIAQAALQLDKFFGEHLYNISSVNNVGKPDPAIYLHVAEKFGCKPHECIAIEDSPHGIMAAKRAGMVCIGINTGNIRSQMHEADIIVEGYEEINMNTLEHV